MVNKDKHLLIIVVAAGHRLFQRRGQSLHSFCPRITCLGNCIISTTYPALRLKTVSRSSVVGGVDEDFRFLSQHNSHSPRRSLGAVESEERPDGDNLRVA